MFNFVYLLICVLGISLASLSTFAETRWTPFVNGGETVGSADPIAKATVMLETDAEYCSATIIGSGLLLTAAHCIGDRDTWVIIHFSGLEGSQTRKADRFLRHEGYQDLMGDDSRNDIALVFFSGGLPEGYQSSEILPRDEVLSVGNELQLAGYGGGGPLGVLAKVNLTITDFLNNNSLIKFNQTSARGICHGDSGGPAYKVIQNKLYVAGVAAYAHEMDCSGYSVYTKANNYIDWVQKQIKN